MRNRVAVVFALLVLAGCGGGNQAAPASRDAQSLRAATTAAALTAPSELGTITDSGFGQAGKYVWATAIVHNNSSYVGQSVTVNFNVLDAAGSILASESQVEAFDRPQADHVIGTQIDLAEGEKAAKLETTLQVEASGAFSDQPFPDVPTSNYRVGKDEYGGPQVSFEIANPLKQPLSSPRIGIVCRDRSGKINGGRSEFPQLVPAAGRIKVKSSVTVSGPPASCKARVGAPTNWQGVAGAQAGAGTAAASAHGQAPSGTAEAAFKTWVDQFAASNWDGQYDTLLSAQQKLISKAKYKACRAKDAAAIKWVKVLSVQAESSTSIPGTTLKLPSTKVTVQVSVNGIKAPVEAHMFSERGQWRWMMTQENLAGCGV